MKKWMVFFILFTSHILLAENNLELEDFANKYLKTFQDTLSFKSFKVVLDVNDSEIVLERKYGTFKYTFDKFNIDDGEMIIEKNFNNINFQLLSKSENPMISINYKINFE
tara:strand:- start:187 stop:516 length:330 start_codon:yes stop_codon:yes gene_type:complete